MKIEMQKNHNYIVISEYDKICSTIANKGFGKKYRLDSCKAIVISSGEYTLLKSYDTIVATIDEQGFGYDFLRYVYGYTSTSAKHISKFFKSNKVHTIYTYRDI